jgi:hypothetical protein
METLKIIALDGTWHAKSDDPQIFALFGTDTLPLPFTTKVSISEVVEKLRKTNPTAKIILPEDEKRTQFPHSHL